MITKALGLILYYGYWIGGTLWAVYAVRRYVTEMRRMDLLVPIILLAGLFWPLGVAIEWYAWWRHKTGSEKAND